MNTQELTLTDVFMPEDLCARCAEQEPLAAIFLVLKPRSDSSLNPSPSSTLKPCKVFFCTQKCRNLFVRGWRATRSLNFEF
jgi:hypothetical protein